MAAPFPMPADLPAHMAYPVLDGVRFCGELRVVKPGPDEKITKSVRPVWELTGDRDMIMVGTKLFPGADQRGGHRLLFTANPRIFQDLVWLMQRYPLRIVDRSAFDEAFRECASFLVKRIRANKAFEKRGADGERIALKAPAIFHGSLADRPWQEEGLAHMVANPRTILGDDLGLGKTVQFLALLAQLEKWPALIVCETHNQVQWIKQTCKFLGIDEDGGRLKLHRIRGTNPAGGLSQAHIYVTHYGLLRHWRQELVDAGIQVIGFDEIQALRKHDSQKYFAATDIAWRADHVVGLSDTPIYGYGIEMWSVMNAVDQQCLGTRDQFMRQWCANSVQVTDPDALGDYLRREGLLLRRTKEMVKSKVPPVHPMTYWVDGDETTFNRLNVDAQRLRAEAANQNTAFDRARLEEAADSAERKATGIAKAADVIALVKTLVADGERVLLGAWHHEVVDLYVEALKDIGVGCFTGRQDTTQKENVKDAFIAGTIKVLIMNLRSGAGVDGLQHVCRIFVAGELDWSPQVHRQIIGRLHREGQALQVLAYFVVSQFGKDPKMMEVLGAKMAQYYGVMKMEADTAEEREAHESAGLGRIERALAAGTTNDNTGRGDVSCIALLATMTPAEFMALQQRVIMQTAGAASTFLALERGAALPPEHTDADLGALADLVPSIAKATATRETTGRFILSTAGAAGLLPLAPIAHSHDRAAA
ncbi:DEAD/DEAH box helicase (plasmid) [Azospirillum sp. HJ39]|uniref:SNF2-related protein n=1 Tax=Azospirillum sp. HJ39 TaxID=3159496 RepID=UPI003557AB39